MTDLLFLFYVFFIGVYLLYTALSLSTVKQSESAIHMHISPFLDFVPVEVSTENQVEFPVPCSMFSLVICFIHSIDSVCMSIPVFLLIPPPLSYPLVSIDLFSTSVSLFLLCKSDRL